jgi:uncharacterized protein YneF (UPF0154 family)
MKTRTLILVTLATGFVASLAALYVGYLIAQKKIAQTTSSNPILNLLSKI